MLIRSLFFFLMLSCSSIAGVTYAQVCAAGNRLTCNDRGNCTMGNADFSDEPQAVVGDAPTNENGMFCDCETGFTGVHCENTIQFCDGSSHVCYHNGACVAGTIQATGETVHVCDCREATEDGTKYVGLHCEKEIPTPSAAEEDVPEGATVCDSGDPEKYCVNDGICIIDPQDGDGICNCKDENTGYHCEFGREQLDDAGVDTPEATTAGTCSIDCLNGGTCYVGLRNATEAELAFNETFDPQDQVTTFEHCRCPDSFSGAFCETNHTECGDLFCFHGSKCSLNPATQENYCECQGNPTTAFAGVNCEHHSTSFCTASEGLNGHQFCTNNGACDKVGDGIYGCTCTGGFKGPHCEFPPGLAMPEAYRECTLQCKNGGLCREGAKTHGMLSTVDIQEIDHILNISASRNNDDFEHCVCPTGFAGLTCATQANLCPNGEHVCFHSTQCVPNGEEYKCDCESSTVGLVAGKYCQHKATTVCNAGKREFCVNGGKCTGDGTCDCPDGHRGPHCEFITQASTASSTSPPDDDNIPLSLPRNYKNKENGMIIASSAIVAVVAILLIVITVIVTGAQGERLIETGPSPPPISAFPPSPGRPTLEDNNVEGSSANMDVEVPPENEEDKDHVNELI